MPVRTKKIDRPPCIPHGPGCDLKLNACRIELDPDSDPVKDPCATRGRWCNLRRASCIRRRCKCEQPGSGQVDSAIQLLIIESKMLESGKDIETVRAEAEAELQIALKRYGAIHHPDGTPKPPHPTPAQIVAATEERVAAIRAVLVDFDEPEPAPDAQELIKEWANRRLNRMGNELMVCEWEAEQTGRELIEVVEELRAVPGRSINDLVFEIEKRWRRRVEAEPKSSQPTRVVPFKRPTRVPGQAYDDDDEPRPRKRGRYEPFTIFT
jgi:hypothetical protein